MALHYNALHNISLHYTTLHAINFILTLQFHHIAAGHDHLQQGAQSS